MADTGANEKIIAALQQAYNAEIETVANYIANSHNLDGMRAKHVKESLAADVTEELNHAQLLSKRIKTIGGQTPGSMQLKMTQKTLQPPVRTTDILSVIKGVIDAEQSAVDTYKNIIKITDGVDHPTQDLAIEILADEQEHLREFLGFLKEFDEQG